MNGPEHEPREEGLGSFRVPGHTAEVPVEANELLDRALPGEPSPDQPEEREPLEERPSPRVYVASLSDYNAGHLHGVWVDAAQPVEETWDEIQRMLMASSVPDAEEWAIHDYDGFGGLQLGEYEPLEFLQEVAEGIVTHGEAFAAFVEAAERDRDRFSLFEQLYQGHWESVEAYAEDLLDSSGVAHVLAELPEWVRHYVQLDIEGLAQSLQAGGVIAAAASDGGVHVFDLEA